jgi:hypothetical protein
VSARRTILEAEPTLTAEPIRAWKRARIQARRIDDDGLVVAFAGVGQQATYSADDTARCVSLAHLSAWHLGLEGLGLHAERIPDPSCTCGFYALNDEALLSEVGHSGVATLEVELLGAVDRYTRGYRAERQRVLRARVDNRCRWCGATATRLLATPDWWSFGVETGQVWLRPACDQCTAWADHAVDALSIGELADRLATEFVWADPPPAPPPPPASSQASSGIYAHLVPASALATLGATVLNVTQKFINGLPHLGITPHFGITPPPASPGRRVRRAKAQERAKARRRAKRPPDRCAFQRARAAMHAGLALVLPPWPRSRAEHPRPQRRRWWFLRRRPTSNGWSITNLGD